MPRPLLSAKMLYIRQCSLPLFLAWLLLVVFVACEHAATQQPLLSAHAEPLQKHQTLPELLNALDVLQDQYFEIWQGVWPTSIDWTSAVIGTYLSAALTTISTSYPYSSSTKAADNLLNKYFSQLTASYFGQDAFALRQEANDDMLWVVLGWLESIKFINTHSALHYRAKNESGWQGEQWTPAFAHRARIFWDLASKGWNTTLCHGGMIWSPYLEPYKNAITNELYITASISMYLYFPGDDNTSPFELAPPDSAIPHDPKYLSAAVEAYRWLNDSNMTDANGLYVDGYHISGWSSGKNVTLNNTSCDERNEMVYTYNQGVLLSGQRGLYEATGARSYLEDGHKLVADTIAATGWSLKNQTAINDSNGRQLGKWHGLGRSGILEEACDADASCSQDSQTFKGILFHHLTLFCAPLPERLLVPGRLFSSHNAPASHAHDVKKWHARSCSRYGKWIKHNAEAALTTLDSQGKFGMWWGAPPNSTSTSGAGVELPSEAVDYRNQGVPENWKSKEKYHRVASEEHQEFRRVDGKADINDLNDRGRGRTVETQGGGIMVLRALWEIVDTP